MSDLTFDRSIWLSANFPKFWILICLLLLCLAILWFVHLRTYLYSLCMNGTLFALRLSRTAWTLLCVCQQREHTQVKREIRGNLRVAYANCCSEPLSERSSLTVALICRSTIITTENKLNPVLLIPTIARSVEAGTIIKDRMVTKMVIENSPLLRRNVNSLDTDFYC